MSNSFRILIFALTLAKCFAIGITADTNRPELSTFVLGEQIYLTFRVWDLAATQPHPVLLISFEREHGEAVHEQKLELTPDSTGMCSIVIKGFVDQSAPLGFYRVRVRLNDGTELPALGSREKGFLTYAIVADPAARRDYGQLSTRFGMLGGFGRLSTQMLPLLGLRWVSDSYNWNRFEPTKGTIEKFPPSPFASSPTFKGNIWHTYTLPSLIRANIPVWALDLRTAGVNNRHSGALNADGLSEWPTYVRTVAQAYSNQFRDLPRHFYQITWEPISPDAFRGTAKQLVQIYSIAYEEIHRVDVRAWILGPTLYPGTEADDKTGHSPFATNSAWVRLLWQEGLGKYIDGFSMHPYWKFPPESNNFVQAVRSQVLQAQSQTRLMLPFYGTEHGLATRGSADELDQARGNIRQTIICLGEGAGFDISFYTEDWAEHPVGGFGYFLNLDPNEKSGSDRLAPKPAAPALAAASFLLDGTQPLGEIVGLVDAGSIGYRFKRGQETITALWNWKRTGVSESLPLTCRHALIYDWMGNVSGSVAEKRSINLILGPEPVYITESN